jgi:hypothetical protein
MKADDLVTIYTTNDANEAELIKLNLRDQGISCQLSGEQQGGFAGLGITQVGVVVRAEDADRAQSIIDHFLRQPEKNDRTRE